MDSRDLVAPAACESDGRATDVVLARTGCAALVAAAPGHAAGVRSAFFVDLDSERAQQPRDALEIVHESLLISSGRPTRPTGGAEPRSSRNPCS